MRLQFPAQRLQWLTGSVSGLFLLLLAVDVLGLFWQRNTAQSLGWSVRASRGRELVSYVSKSGPAAGLLQPGDELLAIDGDTRFARFGVGAYNTIPSVAARRTPYRIDVRRLGVALRFTLDFEKESENYSDLYLTLAVIELLLAMWIAFARPDDPVATVAFFSLLGPVNTFAYYLFCRFPPPLPHSTFLWMPLLSSNIWVPALCATKFDFCLRFGALAKRSAVLRFLRACFYTFGGAYALFSIAPPLARLLDLNSRNSLYPPGLPVAFLNSLRSQIDTPAIAIMLVASLSALIAGYYGVADRLLQRKLRVVTVGLGIELGVFAVGYLSRSAALALHSETLKAWASSFLNTWASVLELAFPLAIAYAIIRHRYLGIRVAIRIGAQYLLAKNVLRAVLYLPMAALVFELLRHSDEPLRRVLFERSGWVFAVLLLLAFAGLRYRRRLLQWIDHRFYRSAYEEEVILADLVEAMQECSDLTSLARTVAGQLHATFRPAEAAILFRRNDLDGFRQVYPPEVSAEAFNLCHRLNGRGARDSSLVTEIISEQPSSTGGASSTSRSRRQHVTTATAIRLSNEDVVGVLYLGAKKSEESYTSRDRRLLQMIATQMGLAYEMLELREQVRKGEIVQTEVLGRVDPESRFLKECPDCGRCYDRTQTHCKTDMAPLEMTLPIERMIDNKYRLQRRIGSGGMGVVYEALDLRLRRAVAVKVMTGRLFGNSMALRRFEREARTVANIQHPNIVSVYDFGTLRGGGAYIVMRLIEGRSLRDELNARGQIGPDRVAAWLRQVCGAVTCAHSYGILHRDLKPENVLLSQGGGEERLTVLDFGLAKLPQVGLDGSFSATGSILGTHGYMSPEQRRGEAVDGRTDIFSLAVLTAEMLFESRPPISGATADWLDGLFAGRDTAGSAPALALLLRTCLADNPAQRPLDVADFEARMVPLLESCPPLLRSQSATVGDSDAPTLAV